MCVSVCNKAGGSKSVVMVSFPVMHGPSSINFHGHSIEWTKWSEKYIFGCLNFQNEHFGIKWSALWVQNDFKFYAIKTQNHFTLETIHLEIISIEVTIMDEK